MGVEEDSALTSGMFMKSFVDLRVVFVDRGVEATLDSIEEDVETLLPCVLSVVCCERFFLCLPVLGYQHIMQTASHVSIRTDEV